MVFAYSLAWLQLFWETPERLVDTASHFASCPHRIFGRVAYTVVSHNRAASPFSLSIFGFCIDLKTRLAVRVLEEQDVYREQPILYFSKARNQSIYHIIPQQKGLAPPSSFILHGPSALLTPLLSWPLSGPRIRSILFLLCTLLCSHLHFPGIASVLPQDCRLSQTLKLEPHIPTTIIKNIRDITTPSCYIS